MIESIRLMNKDILIRPKPVSELRQSLIIPIYKQEQREKANLFEVLKVSGRVVQVKAGDVVLVPYIAHTPIMMIDGIRVAITDENTIMGVIEN